MKRSPLGIALFAAGMFATLALAEESPRGGEAKDQAAALKLARDEDLPAIAKADRVVIKPARGEAVTIKDGGIITAIVAGLVVANKNPSSGLTEYTLTFYKGDAAIRDVWVYDSGEWGVVRTSTSWTCGTSNDLIKAINAALKK